MDLLSIIAKEFSVPVIKEDQKVWFFRTKAGHYYYDFQVNKFIALGWDLISPELIRDKSVTKEYKKEIIEQKYPDEKRPGLILGQMDTFYNQMQKDDFVVIPSAGGKRIWIGKIGDFCNEIVHKIETEDYPQCNFLHRRMVEWVKEVDSWQDVYLFKALRAQQTISDITEESTLVFRNLFPLYIFENEIHLTLQKDTKKELNALNNAKMILNLLDIMRETAELYGKEGEQDKVVLKTAVGSPGFLELIIQSSPCMLISTVVLVKMLIGKAKSSDGSTTTGIIALIDKINGLINDYHQRKHIDAETAVANENVKLIKAQEEKTIAESEKIKADTALVKAQTAKIYAELKEGERKYTQIAFTESGKTTEEIREEQEQLTIPEEKEVKEKVSMIVANGEKMCNAAAGNELSFDKKKIERVS